MRSTAGSIWTDSAGALADTSFPVVFRPPPHVFPLTPGSSPLPRTVTPRPEYGCQFLKHHASPNECCSPRTTRRPRNTCASCSELTFDVIALVEDGGALVSAAARLSPDVIVADISMPGLDGIAAAARIRRNDPEARIVLVTVHAEPMLVEAGLAAGALGYVLKDTAGDELVPAVHAALGGRRYVSRALAPGKGDSGRE